MKDDSKSIEARLILISRIAFIFSMVLVASAAIVIMTQGVTWVAAGLSIIGGFLLLFVNWIAPGVLIIFGYPSLAYALLHGVNPIVFYSVSWESLSSEQRKSAYIYSIFTLLVAIAFIFRAISENW